MRIKHLTFTAVALPSFLALLTTNLAASGIAPQQQCFGYTCSAQVIVHNLHVDITIGWISGDDGQGKLYCEECKQCSRVVRLSNTGPCAVVVYDTNDNVPNPFDHESSDLPMGAQSNQKLKNHCDGLLDESSSLVIMGSCGGVTVHMGSLDLYCPCNS